MASVLIGGFVALIFAKIFYLPIVLFLTFLFGAALYKFIIISRLGYDELTSNSHLARALATISYLCVSLGAVLLVDLGLLSRIRVISILDLKWLLFSAMLTGSAVATKKIHLVSSFKKSQGNMLD